MTSERNHPQEHLLPAHRALQLGWKALEEYRSDCQLLCFNGPVRFEIHWTGAEPPTYVIGEATTQDIKQAMHLLELASELVHREAKP